MLDFARARRNMVDNQLRTFDITDRAVLAAMGQIPREQFLPEDQAAFAYLDQNVRVSAEGGEVRWMLQPMVVGRLLQELEIEPGIAALDVATGRGYVAQVMSTLGANVVALESDQALADAARASLNTTAIEVVTGPLDEGCPGKGPFDVIMINGAVERRPDGLLAQLKDGGRLVCLERHGAACHAVIYVRAAQGFGRRRLFDAAAPVLPAFRAEPAFQF
ncbi:protein-L-isoaspartate O-methyltransferase family protein [Enterovirga sp. CN4-39]|uniref:protein-L-isoaspartate O-methyltransferase family protein n=1 Tax=Enterovirga sp. CN4-39 TaxID=3400910 RepID=UPI003C057CF6